MSVLESRLNKVAATKGLKASKVIKKRLQHKCFHMNYFETFKSNDFEEHLQTTGFEKRNN